MDAESDVSRCGHAGRDVNNETRVVGGYCPACRASFGTQGNPPYSVIHRDGEHLHPISRTRVEPPEAGR